MNYYNPYFYSMPMNAEISRVGLLSRLFGGRNITFSGILNGTQKVLNVANQAIPLVKQVKPVVGNVKTMFRVMSEFKKNDNSNVKNNSHVEKINNYQSINNEGPTFFA